MQLIYNNLGLFVLLVSSFIDISISEPRVVCYYTNWSVYRPGTAKFNPQNINPYLCTHLIYAFGGFTKDNQLKPFDKYQDIEQGGYAKFTGLKTYNKELKTMLAIGGWNEGSTRFSPLVASADRRAQLVKNTIKYLRQNKFDGLDLDWEYPAFRDGGKPKDRENYAKLVQELREEFDREHQKTGRPRLLLTMAVPAGFEYIDKGYDVPKLNKYLDWFNLLSYDYHSAYEPSVNHHAPLYPIEEENEYSFDNDLNINATINYYIKNGADRDKLVLGIPTYGRSYTLFNPDSNEIGAPADGPGEQGDATREKGYLAYYEICQSLKEEDSEWTVIQPNPDALGPYAYNENQWVGYDDEDIVRKKSIFVVEQKLGGIMFWSIDNDDFRGLCNGKQYPLIEAAKESYLDGLENGVQKKSQFDSNKRKQQATTTKKPDTKKNAFGKSTTPAPPTTPSTGSDFKCEEEGFYPHPSDCTKYFWCLEAPGLGIVAHHFSCPSGLVFNKAADSCDYARNVYCTNKAPKTTTEVPSTTEIRTTTVRSTSSTTERISFTKVSSIYKNPSRTTPRTSTVATIEIDSSDLEQEDPKVIKELIELIKKAGGIEELEKQINIQEEHSSGKSDPKVTTPSTATTINKSLVDKIRNRASLFKTRPPLFNGASQPERAVEQKPPAEKVSVTVIDEKEQSTPKKYNSINRFTRPEPQSSGIDKIPESDAVLIEKPQYTSIQRRKPSKPEVIVENDYNNDSDRTSDEDSKAEIIKNSRDSEISKKYTSISRPRRPQVQAPEEEEINEEIETTARTTVTSARTTNKYINLSRRRSTTSTPEEKSDITVETTTPSTQGTRSSIASRRRISTVEAKTTPKTVLEIDTNSDRKTLSRNTFDNTLFKNTATDIERDTLIANKHIHDDDDINHIALPTESVTENLPLPESVTTTQILNTFSPQINAIQNNKVNDSLNEIFDGITEISDIDFTTISYENIVDDNNYGLSEKNNDVIIENNKKNDFIVPKPFTRPKLFQKTTPSPSRNLISRNNNDINIETTKTVRRRPSTTRVFTTTEAYEEDTPTKPRPTYSYRPGYRGTARFRLSTSRSGEYKHDPLASSNQFLEDNRLRSLNIERANKRPPITTVTTEKTTTQERTTRRRLINTTKNRLKQLTTASEEEIETTTEARVVEARNRFNLDPNDRPERIRFELSAGGKIDFGFSSVKSREKAAAAKENDSKVKVITGPLDKSPIQISHRELKKGHVEEIPIQTSPESVTVQNFSDKLELGEIPLNKSDIESFVSDSDLRTDIPAVEDTTVLYRKRLRPSIIGFKKRPDNNEESTTVEIDDAIESSTENLTKTKDQKVFSIREQIEQRSRARLESSVNNESLNENSSTERSKERVFSQRQRFRNRNDNNDDRENKSLVSTSIEEEFQRKSQIRIEPNLRLETSSPRGFQNRFSGRTRTQQSKTIKDTVTSSESESTTAKYLTRVKASDYLFRNRQRNSIKAEDNENSETRDVPEESTLRTFLKASKTEFRQSQEESKIDFDVLDMITEKSIIDDEENEIDFTTNENEDYDTTENSILDTTARIPSSRKLTIRKRPAKKINAFATRQTITEPANDLEGTFESTSSHSLTTEDDLGEEYETNIETDNTEKNLDTTTVKPTRKLVITRKRINEERSSTTTEQNKEEKSDSQNQSTTPKTTRKRILTIRTKTGVIHSPVEVGNFETTEPSTEATLEEESNIEDSDVVRKRIKVYRSRATTERIIEESSTHKPIITRSRVFKRPIASQEETPEVNSDDVTSTSERSRYSQRRKVVKITRRPSTTVTSESEQIQEGEILSQNEETEQNIESEDSVSTSERTRYSPRRKVIKITRKPATIVATESEQIQEGEILSQNEETEQNIESEDSVSTSERTRYSPRRKVIKITRKPATIVAIENEQEQGGEILSLNEETEQNNESEDSVSTSERTRYSTRKNIKITRRPLTTVASENEQNQGGENLNENDESEQNVETGDLISTSERTRYSTRKNIVKITRRPSTSVASELEQESELFNESSSVAPRKTGFRKVLRTKTPRVIIDRPLEEDILVIKTDEENQQVDQNEEKIEENGEISEVIKNTDIELEEPSSPILRYPTRPTGRVTVTVRKRPSFVQGARSTTIHPASTRFSTEGGSNVPPTRSRKIFRPGSKQPTESVLEEIDQGKRIALGERNKKIFTKSYRKTTVTTTSSPNITPHDNIDTESETNVYDEIIDTTDNPQLTNIDGILQTSKPRFSLSRFTTSTNKPTTLHHVFAIDIGMDDINKLKNPENQADEVIKKLQKLIEINRIVEVYSKEEKLKLLKNKKLKSIKEGELTLEKPPALDKFGEITRQVIIKLSVKPNITTSLNATTEQPPNDSRSPKNIMFSETVFGRAETSTISLEGLFEREKKELELKKEDISSEQKKDEIIQVDSISHIRAPAPLLRPESNETNPLIISIANLDQVILSKIEKKSNENEEITTESPEDETTTLENDD